MYLQSCSSIYSGLALHVASQSITPVYSSNIRWVPLTEVIKDKQFYGFRHYLCVVIDTSGNFGHCISLPFDPIGIVMN